MWGGHSSPPFFTMGRSTSWTLQAGIFAENAASIHLHKSVGFCEAVRREKIGKMGGRWRDVMLLERRSEVVGVS